MTKNAYVLAKELEGLDLMIKLVIEQLTPVAVTFISDGHLGTKAVQYGFAKHDNEWTFVIIEDGVQIPYKEMSPEAKLLIGQSARGMYEPIRARHLKLAEDIYEASARVGSWVSEKRNTGWPNQ